MAHRWSLSRAPPTFTSLTVTRAASRRAANFSSRADNTKNHQNKAVDIWTKLLDEGNLTDHPSLSIDSCCLGISNLPLQGGKGNLDSALKNQNASHQFAGSPPPGCSTAGTGDPRTCAQAVSWANSHIGSTSLGTGTCDHVVGLAYGWANSGSHDAYAHWTQVPASSKHAGARTVPAGGLAFFKAAPPGSVT